MFVLTVILFFGTLPENQATFATREQCVLTQQRILKENLGRVKTIGCLEKGASDETKK